MTEEDENEYRITNTCRLWEKIDIDKVRDHCHLVGLYREPAHQSCNINITQEQINFIPFLFHIFSNSDCHLFFK